MRVLAVINGLGTGGAERSLSESIEPLAARGTEIEIAVLHRREEGVEATVRNEAVVHLLEGSPSSKLRSLRRLLRSNKFELVHSTLFDADVLARLASTRRVPALTSLVNTSYDKTRLQDKHIRRTRFEGARAIDALTGRAFSDHYHAITQAAADSAIERLHVPAKRITVIPRGRSAERLGTRSDLRRAAARRELTVEVDAELIVSIGRQEYQKGQVQIIEALSQLEARPKLQLLIAGREGNATPDIARAIDKWGLHERVRVLGHVDNVPDLLVSADAIVFPSHFEGLGGTLIEAMALETPVITSDIPVTHEVMGSAALFVSPGDSAGLAAAIEHLLDTPAKAADLAALGRARFVEMYEHDSVMDRMAELMRNVAGQ